MVESRFQFNRLNGRHCVSNFPRWWLAYVAAAYLIGRVLHAFGMDGGKLKVGRMIGTLTTMLTQLGLAVVAALTAAGVM